MKKQYLTFKQSLCATRIFLNTFGFLLEEDEAINEKTKLKIYDREMNEVGYIYFNNNDLVIFANYKSAILKAIYKIPQIYGFVDEETVDSTFAIFGNWSNMIIFEIVKNDRTKLTGQFLITCSVDTELGANCTAHPYLIYENGNKEKIALKILKDNVFLGIEFETDKYNEKIFIRPFDYFNGFYVHDIKKINYRKYSGIFNGSEFGENRDKLRLFFKEQNGNEITNLFNAYVQKKEKISDSDCIIQKGELMKKLDYDAFKKIKNLREIFLIDEISLLDNLISICYDSYKDEELYALLDLYRKKMEYQNGANCLINSYYGINNQDIALLLSKK